MGSQSGVRRRRGRLRRGAALTGFTELILNAAAFGRTAAVVGQRRNVDNLHNFNTGAMDCADGALAAVTGTFNVSFHLAQAQIVCGFGAILCGHLCGVRGVLFAATEAHLAG